MRDRGRIGGRLSPRWRAPAESGRPPRRREDPAPAVPSVANIRVVEQYLPIVLLFFVVALFAGGSVMGSRLLSPKRRTGAKEGPYESGIAPRFQPAARFDVRFYLIAMIFIIFDIEVIFLYPWAVVYHQLWTFGLAEMAVFAVVVFVAFAYLVSNGALDWGPKRRAGGRPPADLSRTTTATVLRVRRPRELFEGAQPRALDSDKPEAEADEPEPEPVSTA
jgi:NADH-quinone oxidoreductase subunit A